MQTWARLSLCAVGLVAVGATVLPFRSQARGVATPRELVATYDGLADVILGASRTETRLVHSILATTYGHAEATYNQAAAKLASNASATAEIEQLAALVSQLGNEGDAAVAGVRKRLLEGGHHHHASGEQQGLYEEGYVVVTRAAKQALLDSAGRIGKMAHAPGEAGALDLEWQKVRSEVDSLLAGG